MGTGWLVEFNVGSEVWWAEKGCDFLSGDFTYWRIVIMTYPITVFEAKGRDEGGACEKIEASTGIRFRNCDVERQHRFRAAVPSTSHGNLFIERLPFNNRIAILFTGESFEAVSVDVSLNHFTADLALGIGIKDGLKPSLRYHILAAI